MVNLECDLCHKAVKSLKEIDEISNDYQVPGRVKEVCNKCGEKLHNKIKALGIYYSNELAKDVRDYLLAQIKPKILTN